jgi:hypothetical protein
VHHVPSVSGCGFLQVSFVRSCVCAAVQVFNCVIVTTISCQLSYSRTASCNNLYKFSGDS